MKRLSCLVVFYLMVVLVAPAPTLAQEWVLYDDFSTGTLDLTKWSGDAVIVDGKCRMELSAGQLSNNLTFANPGEIVAVRATATVETFSRDIRVGIAGSPYIQDLSPVWTEIMLRPNRTFANYAVALLEPVTFEWIYDLSWGHFVPERVAEGVPLTISMVFDPGAVHFSVDGQESITCTFAAPLGVTAVPDYFLGLRLRNERSSGLPGTATATFDDIYVIYR